MATRPVSRERYSFGNLKEPLELPDLIAIQRESFEWFLNEGLANTFRDISPIKDFSESLQLELEFDPFDEDLRPPPKFTVEECKEKDMTYSAPVFVRARFMNRNTGEIKEQTVFMGDFPIMTDKGTFIVNGTERVVVSAARPQPRRHLRARRALPPPQPDQAPAGQGHDPPLPRRVDGVRRRAQARQGRHRRHPRRPQASPRHLHDAACARLRRGQRPRFPRPLRQPLRLPRRPVGQGARHRPDPGRGPRRDLQAGPSGRTAHGRVGQGLLPQRVLREPSLRPQPRRPLQAQPQAR